MPTSLVYSFSSVILVSLISLVGILTISIKEKTLKEILIYLVSFSAGALLGDAFIHLLPEIVAKTGFTLMISLYTIAGIAFSFIVEKVIHWRHCHFTATREHIHPLGIINLFGESVHNLLDGIIIGVSYIASIEVGIATTVAVILHEIPQEMGDFAILLHAGAKKGKALLFNFLSSLTAILGLILAFILSSYINNITTFLIPFSAGAFIYIAGTDLFPELHKEVKARKSLLQFLYFAIGVSVMLSLLYID